MKDYRKKYKYIISLGYNCEVTYRFIQYFKAEESNLFNWYLSGDIDSLINGIKKYDKIGIGEFEYTNNVWKCLNSNFLFHGKKKYLDINNKKEIDDEINELKGRLDYLKRKFKNIARNESSKLYIYKIHSTDITPETDNKIKELISTLKDFGAINFKLLVICPKLDYNNFRHDDIDYYVRYVDYYPPDLDVTNKKYKNNGWNKIFEEFYCDKPKKKKKEYKFNTKNYDIKNLILKLCINLVPIKAKRKELRTKYKIN